MAQNDDLAERIRRALARRRDVTEKRMFGGVAFMVRGHMACGTVRGSLMVRLGEEGAAAALKEPHVEPMDFTGKPLKTMAYVRPGGIRTDAALRPWVDRAAEFALTLPPRKAGGSRNAKRGARSRR
ncbi:MAG: TfoX/Sxy family protein [Planctomycetes bacterium]|nr:TfoX/Sxy family protein [Planctomycetota bacterium]